MDFTQSKSLLDTVLDRVRVVEHVVDADGNEEVITQIPSYTRLLYVGELADGATTDAVLHTYTNFISEVAPDPDEADTTLRGLMLLQSTCIAHIIEAPAEIAIGLLQRMHTAVNPASEEGAPVLINIRVVMSVEDCPTTLFHRPVVGVLPGGFVGTSSANVDTTTAATASMALYRQVSGLASKAPDLSAPPSVVEEFVDSLRTTSAAHVPSATSVLSMCRSDKLTSAEEFLDIFAAPVTVKTSTEGVHPGGLGLGM